MSGRLGNQMFQYATMYAFSKENNDNDIALNFNHLENETFIDDLKSFQADYRTVQKEPTLNITQSVLLSFVKTVSLIINRLYAKDVTKRLQKISTLDNRLFKRFMKHGIYHVEQGYIPLQKSRNKNKIFIGCFESAQYFDKYRNDILQQFTPKQPPLQSNNKIYSAINKTQSVCITIRRGDFVDNASLKKRQYVCTPEYFYRAIKEIQDRIKDPSFFIFSDDINWVKNNMIFPTGTIFENGNNPVWEKLRMMYSCKHFIISNSSFSWWAQYLSRNQSKIVIAPTRWKNGYQNKDIFQPNWILVNPDE